MPKAEELALESYQVVAVAALCVPAGESHRVWGKVAKGTVLCRDYSNMPVPGETV